MHTKKAPWLQLFACICIAAGLLLLPACKPKGYDEALAIQKRLVDRSQIEDLLVKYYVDLSSGSGHNLAEYYTEDAILDVNGTVYEGREGIQKIYDSVGDGEANLSGKMHMLLNNPIIDIDGDKATAWLIWTGVMNDDLKKPPHLQEQGREFTELVKKDGRWFIQKRYITADSNLPEMWESTYTPRKFR